MNELGFLVYDDRENRFAICEFGSQRTIRLLHCGDKVAVKVKGEFINSHIEMNDSNDELYGWYFVGIGCCASLIGHTAEYISK